jgi:small subunit ribosomal protein S15
MALSTTDKSAIIEKHQQAEADTGSADVQVALMTARITYLTTHMKEHPKDYASRRGLLRLVGQRRRLLKFISGRDPARYRALIASLGLRR